MPNGEGGPVKYEHVEKSTTDVLFSKLDLFGYSMPVRHQTSSRGGMLSVIAIAVVVAASFVNLTDFYYSFYGLRPQTAKQSMVMTPDEELIPKIGVAVKRNWNDFNDSRFFRIKFRQRAIFFSDTSEDQPRLELEIPTVDCTIGNEISFNGGQRVGTSAASCPDPAWSYDDGVTKFTGPTMNGEYYSAQYFYMDVELQPCSKYSDDCASAEELEALKEDGVEVSVSWHGILAWDNEPRWRDVVFLNLDLDKWVGVEIFFTPVIAQKTDWAFTDHFKHWVQFSRFYQRTQPRKVSESEEYIKFYIREESFSYDEKLTYMTILDLMESFGAFWTFVMLTLGALAKSVINKAKSDVHLEHIFIDHGHTQSGKYFDQKKAKQMNEKFNWQTQRDFVELLMRDREDALKEHKAEREAEFAKVRQEREQALEDVREERRQAIAALSKKSHVS